MDTEIQLDTEIQHWYCEVCKKYSLRKDKHLLTRIHNINEARLDRKNAFENHVKRRYFRLMEYAESRPFWKYLEKSACAFRLIKGEFKLFYKDEYEYINYDTYSNYNSDSDEDTDADSGTS